MVSVRRALASILGGDLLAMTRTKRIPAVLQSEQSDCGLACVSMVLQYHGLAYGLRELRHRHGGGGRGMRMSEMLEIVDEYGLEADPYSVEVSELDQLCCPAILHWDGAHFVVLERVARGEAEIVDPRSGRRTLSIEELAKHFSGSALEVRSTGKLSARTFNSKYSIVSFARSIKGLASAAALLIILSLSMNLAVMVSPVLMQWIIDDVALSGDMRMLALVVGAMAFSAAFQVVAGCARSFALIVISNSVSRQWAKGIFGSLLLKKWSFLQHRSLGDITSRVSSLQAIQRALSNGVIEALLDGALAVVTFVVLCLYSWKLALVTLAFVGVYAVSRQMTVSPLRQKTEDQLKAGAEQQSYLLQMLRSFTTIKANGLEQWSRRSYSDLVDDASASEYRVARANVLYALYAQLPIVIERLVIIALGVVLVFQGSFTLGMLVAYLAYKDQFGQRTVSFIDKLSELRALHVHVERVADLIDVEDEPAAPLGESVSSIESLVFRNVSFNYHRSEAILLDCSIEIRKGDFIAIVGESGVGKSTLLKLALALIEPTGGEILVNGIELSRINKASYLKQVGSVLQEDSLLSGTLLENIAIGDADPDVSRVHKVAAAMCIHDDILAMPMGYRTRIGDISDGLSGGQRQRVLLARALYRRPSLLVLDEATSDLDVGSEKSVSSALKDAKITTILVAHRPETIRSAEKVLELKDSRLGPVAGERVAPVTLEAVVL